MQRLEIGSKQCLRKLLNPGRFKRFSSTPSPKLQAKRHQSWPPYFRSLAPGNESRLYQQGEGGEKERVSRDLYLLPFEDIRANRSGRVPGILRIKPTNDERRGALRLRLA